MLSEYRDLVNRAIAHKAVIDSSRRDIRDNEIMISQEESKLNDLLKSRDTTQGSYDYLDKLVKEESSRFIKNLSGILNYAVKVIFFDKDYSIDIRVSDNNRATIHLIYFDDEGNKVEPDIQNCGGGVKTIVGFVAQVFSILKYKAEPILFVDEGFSAVSSIYLPYLFGFISELAEKNNFKLLLITHDTRFENLDCIKNHYKVENGKVQVVTIPKKGGEGDGNSESNTSA